MLKIELCQDMRRQVAIWRRAGERLSFVPTMGYLHEGHLSLLRLAKEHGSKLIASIFVNPTQFNSRDDFEKYPRNLARDFDLLEKAGVDLVFLPSDNEIYAGSAGVCVEPGALASQHEGEFRPGHFSGVLTVVSILFNLTQPDLAVFGEKDFQQLRLVEELVSALHFPLKIVRGPTMRETDGLALSSRNARLTAQGRKTALALSAGLFAAQRGAQAGERSAERLLGLARQVCSAQNGLEVEYLRLVDEANLQTLQIIDRPARLIVAAYVEKVRLIDNVKI